MYSLVKCFNAILSWGQEIVPYFCTVSMEDVAEEKKNKQTLKLIRPPREGSSCPAKALTQSPSDQQGVSPGVFLRRAAGLPPAPSPEHQQSFVGRGDHV